jgi:hypothetical protein
MVPITSQPVVTGDAAEITTAIKNRIDQTTNEVWPWLLAIGIVVLAGCGVCVFALMCGFWLVRRWIATDTARNSYLGTFDQIMERKAQACRTNGAKS